MQLFLVPMSFVNETKNGNQTDTFGRYINRLVSIFNSKKCRTILNRHLLQVSYVFTKLIAICANLSYHK